MPEDAAPSAWDAARRRQATGELFEAQITEVMVTNAHIGGLLVNVDGIPSFLPLSQILSVLVIEDRGEAISSALSAMVGRTLRVRVIEVNERRRRVILSERAATAR